MTAGRLAEVTGLTTGAITGVVDRLEKAGLVRRSSCAGDERGVVATLTEEGWRRLRAAAPGHVTIVRELFLDGLTRKQFAGLAEGIDALRQRLREID